jgi:hypothetical protein
MSTTPRKLLRQKIQMKRDLRSKKSNVADVLGQRLGMDLQSLFENPDAIKAMQQAMGSGRGGFDFADILRQSNVLQEKMAAMKPSGELELEEYVSKLRADGCKPNPVIVKAIVTRLKEDNSLTDEQKTKLRAMIVLYQQDHPEDPVTNDWDSLKIPVSLVLAKKVFTTATVVDDDLSDLSE